MIATVPFFSPRGTPISVYQRLSGLSKLGHEVDLLTYGLGRDLTIPNVTIHRTPQIPFISSIKIGPSVPKLILDAFIFVYALQMLRKKQYDVLHTHEEAAFFGILYQRWFNIPHLYDMHSSLARQLQSFKWGANSLPVRLFSWLERRTLETADAVITIDPELESRVVSANPTVPNIMIENISLPIGDLKENPIKIENDGRIKIVYTGNFESYQGVELIIRAIPEVVKQAENVLFVIVGGDEERINQFQIQLQAYSDFVRFTGTVSLDEAMGWVEAAKIVLSPRIEGTSVPLKIYNYLHAGKAVVATRLQAHTLVLDETNSVLVEPTPASLANGILTLVQNPELRSQLGQSAQTLAQTRYGLDSYLAKLSSIYAVFEENE